MMEKSIKIQLTGGLEARPVAMLVQVASQYESSVYIDQFIAYAKQSDGSLTITYQDEHLKSIMGMMSLALGTGESVKVIANGNDEQAAIDSIEEYLSGKKQQG